MDQHGPIPSRKSRKKKRNRRSAVYRGILLILLSFLLIFLMVSAAYSSIIINKWKNIDLSELENIQQTSFIYDANGEFIASIYGLENRIKVPLSSIPLHTRNAFIAVEDIRFYKHHGFDIRRIFGALIQNIKAGGYAQGASTITQQVIRNTLLSQEKTLPRKIQEVFLAYQLEKKYSKDQILQMYLNLIYFGKGAYGIEAASRLYFGKSTKDLSITESCLLAGIPKNPSRYSPFINLSESLKRKDLAVDLMVNNGYISPEEGKKAKEEKIVLASPVKRNYPHRFFMDMVLEEASDILGVSEEELYTQGYKIYTTLDVSLQKHAEGVYKQEQYFPKNPSSGIPCESALVVMDASSGEIRALLGGRDKDEEADIVRKGLNRATQARRQPGSAIKPLLVYTPAIENFKYTPVTFILDAPTEFGNYKPSNFDGRHRGLLTLRYALAHSINIPAVRVLDDIGVQSGISFAEKLGIPFEKEDQNNLAIALGGFYKGVTPVELARAYAALADNGRYKEYTTIRHIEDSYGITVYQSKYKRTQAITEETAFIMSNILQSTVESGTASRLKELNIPLAAKTGTVQLPKTNEFAGVKGTKDAWIVAYNPDYVVTVWMGFDEVDKKHYLPEDALGGIYPAEVAKSILQHLYKNKKPTPFQKPLKVVEVKLDAKSLWEQNKVLLASPFTPAGFVITEYFTPETAPREQSDYWLIPQTPDNFGVTLNNIGLPIISFKPQDTFAAYDIYRLEEGQDQPLRIHQTKTGTLDMVEWVDTMVNRGSKYNYYVVPVHPEIHLRGQAAEGPPTQTISITVPALPASSEDKELEENATQSDTITHEFEESRSTPIRLELVD
jgi:penicillin-binding protein 1A